ncbi:MAG: cytochrome c [Lentisphaeraceae bacterium]|nr:cytochrome c [Lentisphaeraceae bacterium]
MSIKSLSKAALIVFSAVVLFGCRGSESKKTPIHLNPNLDLQEKYKPQEEGSFFEDGGTMRAPVEGTIPLGDQYVRNGADYLKADSEFYQGLDSNNQPVDKMPSLDRLGFKDTASLLARGKERYEIYCTPCHGSLGNGKGLVAQRGFPNVLDISTANYKAPLGQIYKAINIGGAVMPSYAYQIKVRDRWAIVAYVKVLQKAAADPAFAKPVAETGNK